MGRDTHRWWQQMLTLVSLAAFVVVAACATSGTTSTTGTPPANPRGTWQRPAFPGLSQATVSSVGFADGNAQIGYACAATLAAPTSVPTANGTNTPTPGATATPGLPGRPTAIPTNNIVSSFWRTSDGGLTWQSALLPQNLETDLLCPISTIVAPDLNNPQDVFFLAAFGALNLQNPSSIAPNQAHFELWRSTDGAITWQQLTLPVIQNPFMQVAISPFHLVIVVQKPRLLLGAEFDDAADYLFSSTNNGKTWQLATGVSQPSVAPLPFAGFAAGPNGSLLALAKTTSATAPYALYQTADAKTWKVFGAAPPITVPTGAQMATQLFSAPGGGTLFVLARSASQDTTPATIQATAFRSTDGGQTWTNLGWPTEAPPVGSPTPTPTANATATDTPTAGATAGATATATATPGVNATATATPSATTVPVGSLNIVTLGTEFAVDANGDAFMAPPNSDLPPQQDDLAPLSAGIFSVTSSQTQWNLAVAPPSSQNTAFTLAVSLVAAATVGGTATPATATATATVTGTGTPVSGATGLPTVWTNFGPLAQFTTDPSEAGFFYNILPSATPRL
jgi:hypothetical protein